MFFRILLSLILIVGIIPGVTARTITGTVVDAEDREPLIGVTVMYKGTSTGKATDYNGKFLIDVGDATDVTLVFTYVGMKVLEKEVADGDTDIGTVFMQQDSEILDEVYVSACEVQVNGVKAGSGVFLPKLKNANIGKIEFDTKKETTADGKEKITFELDDKCTPLLCGVPKEMLAKNGTLAANQAQRFSLVNDSDPVLRSTKDGYGEYTQWDDGDNDEKLRPYVTYRETIYDLLLLKKNKCKDIEGVRCTQTNSVSDSVKYAEWKAFEGVYGKRVVTCIPTECNGEVYKLEDKGTKDAKCVSLVGDDCAGTVDHAKTARYVEDNGKLICNVTECESSRYKPAKKNAADRYNTYCEDQSNSRCDVNKDIYPGAIDGVLVWDESSVSLKCVPSSCDKNAGYELKKANTLNAMCELMVGGECEPDTDEYPGAYEGKKQGKYIQVDGGRKCVPTRCKCGYDLKDNNCDEWEEGRLCTADTKPSLSDYEHAKSAEMACDKPDETNKGDAYCKIIDCISKQYKVDEKKNQCVDQSGNDCTPTDSEKIARGIKYKYKFVNDTLKCMATDCNGDDYTLKDNQCIQTSGPCPEDKLREISNATQGNLMSDGSCCATLCESGYHVSGCKCVLNDLSEAEQNARIDELRKNAQNMKDKEQSTANKLLGGATMAATGIGGMQLAEGLAQKAADEEAELDMAAYLATFRCNWNNATSVRGGEKNIQIPGSGDLAKLVTEYKELAADLKMRKEQLGMAPGIESEQIIDSATTGLYDDVGIGRGDGAYTSLADALSDPSGADAAEWAEQKDGASDKVKLGAGLAGGGAVAGAAGNLIINRGDDKQNKSDAILNHYESIAGNKDRDRNNVQTFAAAQQAKEDGEGGTSGKQDQDEQ